MVEPISIKFLATATIPLQIYITFEPNPLVYLIGETDKMLFFRPAAPYRTPTVNHRFFISWIFLYLRYSFIKNELKKKL